METEIPQKKHTRFTPSVVLNIILLVGVLAVIALVLYAPKANFFKGALLFGSKSEVILQVEEPKEDQVPGALLIDYVTKSSDVSVDGQLITLTSLILEAENEKMSISSFLFEFEGATNEYSIQDTKLLINGHELTSSNYIWISPSRLLIEVSADEVSIEDRLPVMLQGILKNVDSGQKINVFVSDISATGKTLNKAITSIGAKGEPNVAGTILFVK
ncbi:hypothetical protein C0416_04920 [bacterium]|nr:hypothetical protein [bacterium]